MQHHAAMQITEKWTRPKFANLNHRDIAQQHAGTNNPQTKLFSTMIAMSAKKVVNYTHLTII
jgi:hypothetical protein